MYYKYVAFNEGRILKTAKFKKIEITTLDYLNYSYSFPDVRISEIPIDALRQLKEFIDNKRNPSSTIFEKTTFCKTIYNDVIHEISLRNTGMVKRNINSLQEKQRFNNKFGKNAERYKEIINQINKIKSEIDSIQSDQLSGPDDLSFPRNTSELRKIYHNLEQEKKFIELSHGIY